MLLNRLHVVAQDFRDVVRGSAVAEQAHREGVTEAVRMNVLNLGALSEGPETCVQAAISHRLVVEIHQNRVIQVRLPLLVFSF